MTKTFSDVQPAKILPQTSQHGQRCATSYSASCRHVPACKSQER